MRNGLLLFLLLLPVVARAQLDDTGLISRFYLDEAASGTGPTETVDAASGPLNLTLNYDAGTADLEYTEVTGNRGLDSKDTAGAQRADRNLAAGDKIYDGIHGSKTATFEIVVDQDGCSASNGRWFAINGRGGDNPHGGFNCTATNNWTFYFNETGAEGYNDIDTTKVCLHVVYDTALADADDRVKIYENGTLLTESAAGTDPTQNATFNLTTCATACQLIMLNRETSGPAWARSVDGILFYAALYSVAFTATRAGDHCTILNADDDTPAAGARRFMLID
ncbi:MAG: hypothetical protein HY313_00970 [Acidobacteria bacterium]|nr:hypothetical protein [Acidobacteriota bacterium]